MGKSPSHLFGELQRVFVDQLPGTSFGQKILVGPSLTRTKNEAGKGPQDLPVQPSLAHRIEGSDVLPAQQQSLGFGGLFPVCPIHCEVKDDNKCCRMGIGSGRHQVWGQWGPGMGQRAQLTWRGPTEPWPGLEQSSAPPGQGVTDSTHRAVIHSFY